MIVGRLLRGPLSSSLGPAVALEAARLLLGWGPDNQLSLPLHHSEHTVDATSHPADSVHAPLARFSAVHAQAQARCIFRTPRVEVTHDERFTGAWLAAASTEAIGAILIGVAVNAPVSTGLAPNGLECSVNGDRAAPSGLAGPSSTQGCSAQVGLLVEQLPRLLDADLDSVLPSRPWVVLRVKERSPR